MDEANSAARRAATTENASVALDDLAWMRTLVAQTLPDPASARRLGTALRRLLIDGELRDVANPRIGRIMIESPDLSSFYNLPRMFFFYAANHGHEGIESVILRRADDPVPTPDGPPAPTPRFPLRIDHFLAQQVVCCRDQWATRKDVIRFIANRAGGSHTKGAETQPELVLAEARRLLWYVEKDGKREGVVAMAGFGGVEFVRQEGATDSILMEALGAAALLCNSPDIHRLEAEIRARG